MSFVRQFRNGTLFMARQAGPFVASVTYTGSSGKTMLQLRQGNKDMFSEEAEDGGKFWEINWDKEKAMSSYRVRTQERINK